MAKTKASPTLGIWEALARRSKIRQWLGILSEEGLLKNPGKFDPLSKPTLSEMRESTSAGALIWGVASLALGALIMAKIFGFTPGAGLMFGSALLLALNGVEGKSDAVASILWLFGYTLAVEALPTHYDALWVNVAVGSTLAISSRAVDWRNGFAVGLCIGLFGAIGKTFFYWHKWFPDANIAVVAATAMLVLQAIFVALYSLNTKERESSGTAGILCMFTTLACAGAFCWPGTHGVYMVLTGLLAATSLLITYLFSLAEMKHATLAISSRVFIARSGLLSIWMIALPSAWLAIQAATPETFANGFAAMCVIGLFFIIKPQRDFADGLAYAWDEQADKSAGHAPRARAVGSKAEIFDVVEEMDVEIINRHPAPLQTSSLAESVEAAKKVAEAEREQALRLASSTPASIQDKQHSYPQPKSQDPEVKQGNDDTVDEVVEEIVLTREFYDGYESREHRQCRLWLSGILLRAGETKAAARLESSGSPRKLGMGEKISRPFAAAKRLAGSIGTKWLVAGWLALAILVGLFGNVESFSKAWGAFGALFGFLFSGIKEIWRLEEFGVIGIGGAALAVTLARMGMATENHPNFERSQNLAALALCASVATLFDKQVGGSFGSEHSASMAVAALGGAFVLWLAADELARLGSGGSRKIAAIAFGGIAAAAGMMSELTLIGAILFLGGLSCSRPSLAKLGVYAMVGGTIHLASQAYQLQQDALGWDVWLVFSGLALIAIQTIISGKLRSWKGSENKTLIAAGIYAIGAAALFIMAKT